MIKLYSTPTCPYCVTLKKFLEEKKVDFEYIDVSQNEQALKEMIDKSGQLGVPVVEIDGQIIIGFNKQALKKALDIK